MTDPLDLDALIAFVHRKQAKHTAAAQRRDALEHWDSADAHTSDAATFDQLASVLDRLRAAERRAEGWEQEVKETTIGWRTTNEQLHIDCDGLREQLRAAEQARDDAFASRDDERARCQSVYTNLAKLKAERDALQASVTALEAQCDDVASAYAALQHEAEEARDAWQARIAELEAQPSPGLAVDLAAFLNLTGEAVADALNELGYRLIVERDPSA